MRSFERRAAIVDPVPASVARALSDVDVGRGSESLHSSRLPGVLQQLARRARVQSVKASSALEGVIVPDERRADRIIEGSATRLRTRSERELAGYRDALDYVWQTEWRPLNVGLVLHLHRLLHGHTAISGGAFKSEDNLVVDMLPDGRQQVRFRPVSAGQTPWFTEELVARYRVECAEDSHHPLLLVGLMVLDLLVIHPFTDGNGRVARVLTNALMSEAGYGVARYVSVEQLVAESAGEYYGSLLASTHHWHEGIHDPWPWLAYFVDQVGAAYRVFGERAALGASGSGKRDQVKRHVLEHDAVTFRISDLRAALPGISDGTLRNALDDLRREGKLAVDGTGRGAAWFRLGPNATCTGRAGSDLPCPRP